MRAPQERTVRDLYDRTRHKDPAAPEDKTIVRKRLLSNDNIHVKAESGTCNVCYAPCSSCLHRSLGHADSNIDCESSQTCSTRSEIKHSSLLRTEKGVCSRGENGDEFSAASNNGSYSETVGNKVGSRLSIAEDSSEVDMPAKRRRLSKDDMKLSRAECRDDKNSCITGMAAEGKHLHKKRLPTSASSRDLTIKECKDNSVASNSRLRKLHADESTEKHRSDVMHPSSSVMAKRLLRTQSSISASKGFSPRRQAHEFGDTQQNVSCQLSEKASLSNIIKEEPLDGTSNPCVDAGDNNDLLTGCNASMRNEKKAELTPKDFGNNTSCSEDQIQEQAVVQTNDDVKKTGVVKKDQDQDSSMDISSEGVLNMQNDVMTDCGNSEGLIDVNVCDICGDVGREYLLATCTRCLEGAEHTYCMLVKLDKVPDGEWLCEECKLKDDSSKTRFQNGGQKVDISEGKNQSSDNQNNPKALRVVVPNFDAPRVNYTTADQCDAKNKKLHLAAADTQLRQANVISPVAEGLEVKNNKLLSMANRKKLQVITSDLEARSRTSGVQTPSSSNKKNQSSEVCSNHKKLRVSTDLETPLSSEGLRSPPTSCKRLAENTSSPNLRLFKANSLKKRDSCESSFKKSNEVSVSSLDNASVRNGQTVKSSQTLSRSYSMGSMVNAKAPVPSPRGHLSKQRSFNSSNNGPKVKQLSEGARSKLRPVKHSPKDLRDQGPIKKIMRSDSFKFEGSVCKDAGSPKQKQSFHLSQDEKPVILKSMKEKNMKERRASFSFKKPNIPSSPRHDSSVKPGERKLYQGISRPGPSILKSSKKPGNAEKESTDLSKSGKREISVHQKPIGFVSGKDIYAVNIPDPPVPSQCVKRDNSNDGEEDSFILVKNGNGMPTEPPEVLPATSDSMTLESDLRDVVPRVGALEGSASKVVGFEQKPLVGTINSSCRDIGVVQVSDDKLPVIPHGLQIINNRYSTDNKFDKSNLKQEAYLDQSITGNLSGNLVIPEQSYIWQGSFEVSRRGIPEVFDGIQAYLSTCASCKVREVGKQLPYKIQLAEVPRRSSWPLQFEEVNPTEDNIALFFFAKDAESYERAYGKLLEDMVLGDLCLIANIGGTELLIFPSDKLPERTQHWNGLLFFWGFFYARKASSLPVLPVTGTYNCPLGPIPGPVIQHDECLPKALQCLGIDLNECPHDDLSDPAVSPKTSAAIDQNIWFKPKHEGRNLDSRETYHEETAGTRHIVSGHPTAAPCGIHFPRIPTEGHHMVKDYPNAAKDTSGIAGNGNVEEHAFCQPETLLCVAQQAGTGSSMSEEMVVKEQAYQPSVEASPCHFSGSKISDDSNHLVPKSGIVSSYSCYKRQKTSHGRHSSYSFEELPSKYLSKIHPTPAGQKNPFKNVQYIYSGPSDPGSHKKLINDREVHVLSSDDEDSPVPSTSLNNKASRKADESSSPLLPLSLSTVATKHNIAGSDIEEAEPLSLSLGLPDVVEGNRVLEMKQFLPEKPGINT